MKSLSKTVLSAAAGILFTLGSAQAATVEGSLFPGTNQLSDNSAESLINVNGLATVVDIGDRLRGIFVIDSVEALGGGGTRSLLDGSGNNELTGFFDVTVASKINTGAGFIFTFAPTASFAAEIGGPVGSAVAFFDGGATHNYSRIDCGTIGAGGTCEANVTDGSPLWVAGFGGDAFWQAFAFTDDIAAIGAGGSSQVGGFFNIGLELLVNSGSRVFNSVVCNTPQGASTSGLEFCGSGSLLGRGGASTPYDSFDNVDFTINVVPEPTSVALAGLALLGLGLTSRRRKI